MNFEGKTGEFISPQQVLGSIDDSLLGGDPDESVNVLLINEVKKYPILYDFNHEKYSDKDIRARIWSRISEDVGMSTKEAKHQWKRLRDSLRDALKRQGGKLGIGCRKTWRYHKKMEFVVPFMTNREPGTSGSSKRSRNRKSNQPGAHPNPHPHSHQDAALSMLASALHVNMAEGSNYYNHSTSASGGSSSSGNRLYKAEGMEMSLLEELAHKPLDEDLYFCLSMAASMKRLTEQRRARLKCDMMSMLYTAQCEEAFP